MKKTSSIQKTFDTVATGYDNPALRYFQESARRMADYFDPAASLRLLDVATGTGNAAIALAAHLPQASITGIDFAPAMLAQARAKATEAGLRNVKFREMDMQQLAFPDASFDAAVCAFGVFFAPEMTTQLRHIAAKVKAGGTVLISCFYEGSFSPCADLFLERIEQYGLQRPPLRWQPIASEAACMALFREVGLTDIRVERLNLGYDLESADQWWDIVWNGGFRGLVDQLPASLLDRFRLEHLQEIEALRSPQGIRLHVDVLHTIGRTC